MTTLQPTQPTVADMRTKAKMTLQTLMSENSTGILEQSIWIASSAIESIYRWYVYQIYGDLLTRQEKRNAILARVKKGEVGWQHPSYNKIRDKIAEHDDYLIKPFDVEEGVITCPKCQSQRVFSFSKQVRSADEPMTTFSRCAKCEYNWTYSG